VIALLLALALAGPLQDGAEAYDRGEWQAAIDAWGAVESPSGAVLYDLGSAHYRAGDLPRAIAHWRAAARLRPRDGALAHDLALARAALDELPPPVDPPLAWLAFGTVGELGLVATALLALASGLLALRRRRGGSAWPAALAGGAGIALGAAALAGAEAVVAHPVAVVVDAPAVARDAARPDADERFRLPPGAEVLVERDLGGFRLVRTGDGRRGWIPSGAAIAPGAPGR
jgi:hypothetical protein